MGTFPPQIKYIVGNEACERFSYYGMLSILTLYLSNVMRMGGDRATQTVHLFATAVYFLPLVGGWLADRFLGRYWTILSLSLFYCAGHVALSFFEGDIWGIYLGLGLIAFGAGGIKPCVSAFVGDQFHEGDEDKLRKVYGLFYAFINLGAFFGPLLIPMLRDTKGYSWAFALPGIFMALATVIFWAGRRHYTMKPPLKSARAVGGPQTPSSWPTIRRIILIFLPVPIFWALFNQVHTTWVLQAERMTPFYVMDFKVDAERMQSTGALLVLFWVPVLTLGVYPVVERLGLRATPLRRMGFGMFLAAVAFIASAWIQSRIDGGARPMVAWQILPYTILEAGEVMVSATALEFAFSQAPPAMKSMIMSLWLMTIAGGHFLVAAFTNLNTRFVHAKGASEFLFYAVLMFVGTGVFAWIASRYRERRPAESEAALAPA
jgi:POT family proton-dependent oligopeptide transporter